MRKRGRGLSHPSAISMSKEAKERKETLNTSSKLILIDPTFVAPTGTIAKEPYRHLPSKTMRSFSTKRFSRSLTMYGDTEKSSPTSEIVLLRSATVAAYNRQGPGMTKEQ